MFWIENLGAVALAVALTTGWLIMSYKIYWRMERWLVCRAGTASKKTTEFQRREIFVNFADLVPHDMITQGSALESAATLSTAGL